MSELVFREGFWVRADNIEQDLVVVRDVFQGDAYRTSLLDGKAFDVVVDIGAHIGTFARLWHAKNPKARIVCVEACPENIPALQKNVGAFAKVIHAACSYQNRPLALLNAVRPQCESTGGSTVVPADALDTAPRQPGYRYWKDERPLPTITLEQIMADLGVDHIDLLKLDCEGSEYDILQNTRSLPRTRFVLGEYHDSRRWESFRSRLLGHWDYGHMYQAGDAGGLFHLANRSWPPTKCATGRNGAAPQRVLRLAVPSGIGDILWVLTKVPALLAAEGAQLADIDICHSWHPRSVEFVQAFDFVGRAAYCEFECVEAQPMTTPDGCWNYAPSQPRWHDRYDWLLVPNGHLERGRRLEDWLPHLETDWEIARRFQFQPEQDAIAAAFAREVDGPFVVLFAASEPANTTYGHNRGPLWTPAEWAQLCAGFLAEGVRPVFVGAAWDRSYFDKHLRPILPNGVVDRIEAWPIGVTFAVIRKSKGVVAFQSGLGVFAVYLGVPTAMWWRPLGNSIHPDFHVSFREEMAHAWAPPGAVASGRYLPLIYTRSSPESILAHARDHWLR